MITTENIPNSYKPFNRLIVCSNTVVGGGTLVSMGKVLPLLIGMGPKPLIWMQAVENPQAKTFVTIVDASISTHPAIRVTERKDELLVYLGDKIILSVKAEGSDTVIINELDLRPLGMDIYGDESKLFAGDAHFSGNTFVGVSSVIAFSS